MYMEHFNECIKKLPHRTRCGSWRFLIGTVQQKKSIVNNEMTGHPVSIPHRHGTTTVNTVFLHTV